MRRVTCTEVSHAVKSGYSYGECDVDGSEPCCVHSIEEKVGWVLWDAKSFEVSDPLVWVLGSNVFRGFGCGRCMFEPKRQRVLWQLAAWKPPDDFAGVRRHPGAGSVSEPLGCGRR